MLPSWPTSMHGNSAGESGPPLPSLYGLFRLTTMVLGQLQGWLLCLRSAKMQSVSEVLQLPVIIEGSWPLSAEFQFLQKRDFLLGRIAAEGRILEEVFEPGLFIERLVGFAFNKPKFLRGSRGQSAVSDDSHFKRGEIDIPGFNLQL